MLHHPSLYQNRYLVSDIQGYRAAASLVPIAQEMCEKSEVDPSDIAGLARLADWQGLYAPTGQSVGPGNQSNRAPMGPRGESSSMIHALEPGTTVWVIQATGAAESP